MLPFKPVKSNFCLWANIEDTLCTGLPGGDVGGERRGECKKLSGLLDCMRLSPDILFAFNVFSGLLWFVKLLLSELCLLSEGSSATEVVDFFGLFLNRWEGLTGRRHGFDAIMFPLWLPPSKRASYTPFPFLGSLFSSPGEEKSSHIFLHNFCKNGAYNGVRIFRGNYV